jgi:hypothetical protein
MQTGCRTRSNNIDTSSAWPLRQSNGRRRSPAVCSPASDLPASRGSYWCQLCLHSPVPVKRNTLRGSPHVPTSPWPFVGCRAKGTESLLTLRWRETASNFRFRPVPRFRFGDVHLWQPQIIDRRRLAAEARDYRPRLALVWRAENIRRCDVVKMVYRGGCGPSPGRTGTSDTCVREIERSILVPRRPRTDRAGSWAPGVSLGWRADC